MSTYLSETIWINDNTLCSFDELLESSGLSKEELQALIEHEILIPIDQNIQPYQFQMHYIFMAKKARRLRDDFELDLKAVILALNLLHRIDELEAELNILRE